MYLRNRIRAHVLPALQMCDTRFDDNFLLTLQRIQQDESYFNRITKQIFTIITNEQITN